MKKKELIEHINNKYNTALNNHNTSYSNINTSKNVWWFNVPVSKFEEDVNLLLNKKSHMIWVVLPKGVVHDMPFRIRKDRDAVDLEISADNNNTKYLCDVKSGGAGFDFSLFIKEEIPYLTKKKQPILLSLFGATIGILGLLIWWLFDNKKKRAVKTDRIIKKLRKENYETKTTYLNLLEKYIKSKQNIDLGIIEEIHKLKKATDILDFEVHIELEEVVNNLSNGKSTEAVRLLAKVIEKKLKEKAEKEETFKGRPMLHNLLEFGKSSNWITSQQYENALALKEIRNKESHELDVQEETKNIGLCIFSGIDLIYALK
ncbi:hypothetical protein [Tenacibaculum halocynthiae]|uniref:hypothetical protein n=1 Tax=Tenacibaculum halocynthiae TaxID=1254437 RepID=UPI003893D54E